MICLQAVLREQKATMIAAGTSALLLGPRERERLLRLALLGEDHHSGEEGRASAGAGGPHALPGAGAHARGAGEPHELRDRGAAAHAHEGAARGQGDPTPLSRAGGGARPGDGGSAGASPSGSHDGGETEEERDVVELVTSEGPVAFAVRSRIAWRRPEARGAAQGW